MQAGSAKTCFLKWCLGEVFGQKTSIKELQHGNLRRGADTCYPAQPPSCHNGACGATKQQDLTYAMSALHLLSRFPFMQVDYFSLPKPSFTCSSLLREKPTEQPFLPAPSVSDVTPAALPSFRYLGRSISWGWSPRPAAGLSCTLVLHHIPNEAF